MFSPQIDLAIRFVTLALLIYWQFYWIITERASDSEKPKSKPKRSIWFLRKISSAILGIVLGLQLFWLPILPFDLLPEYLFILQLVGCLLVIAGVAIAISARKTLGSNWAHAYEYQIKQRQSLVTDGVYRLIRHPIYTGLMLGLLGGELVVGSYLVLVVLPLLLFGFIQAKREEKILLQHFGEAYKKYMQHSRMFIPYLW